jgi:hypothetical protein
MDFTETVDELMSGVATFRIPDRLDKMEICHSFALPVDDGGFLEEHQILSDHIWALMSSEKT